MMSKQKNIDTKSKLDAVYDKDVIEQKLIQLQTEKKDQINEDNKHIDQAIINTTNAIEEVFSKWKSSSKLKQLLSCALLIKNTKVLLDGEPGVGKTTFINCITKSFGAYKKEVTASSDLISLENVGFYVDLAELMKGKEHRKDAVQWTDMLDADIMFVNELSRTTDRFQIDLLKALAENRIQETITYSTKSLQSHVMWFFDQNPGIAELTTALADRMNLYINVPKMGLHQSIEDINERFSGKTMLHLEEHIYQRATLEDLLILQRVADNIPISPKTSFYGNILVQELSACIYTRTGKSLKFVLPCDDGSIIEALNAKPNFANRNRFCKFEGKPCSLIKNQPGTRLNHHLFRLAKAHRLWRYIQTIINIQYDNQTDRVYTTLVKSSNEIIDGIYGTKTTAGLEVDETDLFWAYRYVADRIELKPSVAKNWSSTREWVEEELFPYVQNKMGVTQGNILEDTAIYSDEKSVWREFVKYYNELIVTIDDLNENVDLSDATEVELLRKKKKLKVELKARAAENHELRDLISQEAIGIKYPRGE